MGRQKHFEIQDLEGRYCDICQKYVPDGQPTAIIEKGVYGMKYGIICEQCSNELAGRFKRYHNRG
jgi:methionyl-tRNA synthetase